LNNFGPGTGRKALGIIETRGRAPLIEVVDCTIKSARVDILASYFVGGGCNTVTLVGDVGSLRAALDAAQAMIDSKGIEGITHLIPRLAGQVWPMVAPATPVTPVKPVKARKVKAKTEKRNGTA
jgi:energy-coupling factor transport system substrate-specific component